MTPDWRIEADNTDVTQMIRRYFQSMTITDIVGRESDSLEIELDDRDGLEAPAKGLELFVKMGYLNDLCAMGVFVVDTPTFSGFPKKLIIKAKSCNLSDTDSLNLKSLLKQFNSRSFHGKTIGEIVTTIGNECGYQAQVVSALSGISIEHIDQTEESNLNFLTRLAQKYGGILKITNREVHLFEAEQSANTWLINQKIHSYSFSLSERAAFGGVKAYWHDQAAASRMMEYIGTEPFKELPGNFPNSSEAFAAANAEWRMLQRGKAQPSITLDGNANWLGGDIANLSGLAAPRPEMQGNWKINEARHRIDGNGFISELKLEVPNAI